MAFTDEALKLEKTFTQQNQQIKRFTTQEQILGTDNDNADFRSDLNSGTKQFENSLRSTQENIVEFKHTQVPYDEESALKDKAEACSNTLEDIKRKFNAIKRQIDDKQRLYITFQNRRRSSVTDLEKNNINSNGSEPDDNKMTHL